MQTIAPYTTIIVLNLLNSASATNRDSLKQAVKDIFLGPQASNPKIIRSSDLTDHTFNANGSDCFSSAFSFTENRLATWDISQAPVHDTINVLCVISVYKGYACLHISDSESKALLEKEIKRHPQNFNMLAPTPHINPKILETAFFVDAQFKALWLSGGHKRTLIKPSAKQLNGDDLQYALDPLGDQTFVTRSGRAQTPNSASYGVTPGRSVIWRGPNEGIDSYCTDIVLIVSRIEIAEAALRTSPFIAALPMLMNTCESWNGVTQAYSFSLVDEDSVGKKSKKVIQRLNSLFAIDLLSSSSSDASFTLEARLLAPPSQTQRIDIIPTLSADLTSVTFKPTTANPNDRFLELLGAIEDSPEIWRCWYNSYHTITAGKLCITKRRHAPFNDWTWYDFSRPYGFNIEKEKPENFSDIWNMPSEDSLFSWCIKSASGLLNNNDAFGVPNTPCLEAGKNTWIYCDDNSREIADFVYFHNENNRSILGLIHAKGAHNSSARRQIVPTPFEVVTAQATKNLVDFENEKLLARIRSRVQRSSTQKIWNAPWTTSAPNGNAINFLAALNSISAETELFVIIVQPHVSKSNYYMPNSTNERIGIAQEQLRTLLHSVKAATSGVNAKFTVVADGR